MNNEMFRFALDSDRDIIDCEVSDVLVIPLSTPYAKGFHRDRE